MDYYAKIKPTLNKLSKLEVFDSLDVVRRYVKCSLERKDKAFISGIKMSEANSIEIWFADFKKHRDRYLFHVRLVNIQGCL